MPEIRQYKPTMKFAVLSCFRACVEALGWDYDPQGKHADMLDIGGTYMKGGNFWCLCEDGAIVGTAAVRPIGEGNRAAEMRRLYVLPEYQGRGYGGMLFRHALDYAKEAGFRSIRLSTRHDRQAALRLIEKHRFRKIELYGGNNFAELFFELDLNDYKTDNR